jgi:hypothetical protein
MFLNEFLKEHRKVEILEATVANLVTTVKSSQRKSEVSAQLEMNKPAPQTVLNNRQSSGAGEILKSSPTIAKPVGAWAGSQL